jgi:hypothetical protein
MITKTAIERLVPYRRRPSYVQDGLSYGPNAGFNMSARDDGGRFFAGAIAAP